MFKLLSVTKLLVETLEIAVLVLKYLANQELLRIVRIDFHHSEVILNVFFCKSFFRCAS